MLITVNRNRAETACWELPPLHRHSRLMMLPVTVVIVEVIGIVSLRTTHVLVHTRQVLRRRMRWRVAILRISRLHSEHRL